MDVMSIPKISVLVPTYNYGVFLAEALESIRMQDLDDFEVIISDDASLDNTVEVATRFVQLDSRFHFFRHDKNIGMVENWNWCLARARGTYVQFLFADDFFVRADALSKLSSALDRCSGVGLAVASRYISDTDSRLSLRINDLGRSGIYRGESVVRRCLFRGANLIGEPSVVMFRRALMDRGFDTGFRQAVDLEMWCYLCSSSEIFFIEEPLCAFRRHEAQQTVINARENVGELELYYIFERYSSLLGGKSRSIGSLLYYYATVFGVIKSIRRSRVISSQANLVMAKLESDIPWWAWVPAYLVYRITKQTHSLLRSFRRFLA